MSRTKKTSTSGSHRMGTRGAMRGRYHTKVVVQSQRGQGCLGGDKCIDNRHDKKDESTRKTRRSGEARTNAQCTIMHTRRVDMRLKLFRNVLCRYVVSDASINPVQSARRHSVDVWLVSCSCRQCRRRGLQQGQLTISNSAARP